MSIWRCFCLLLLVMTMITACSWPYIPTNAVSDAEQLKAKNTVTVFQQQHALAPFFDSAVAYVIFPDMVRAATGFGGAYGGGWLIYEDEILGRVQAVELSIGASLGAKWYRQILFFKTEDAFRRFQRGGFEFSGQANFAAGTKGGAVAPSYNSEVALFSELQGGFLVEASVGAYRFDYRPLSGN